MPVAAHGVAKMKKATAAAVAFGVEHSGTRRGAPDAGGLIALPDDA